MIINNPNALRGWLTKVLQPICVADPAALARYVFALLKKDKPVKELKKIMIEQLNVFLGTETKPFLERLFAAIASEEYLNQTNNKDDTVNNVTTTNNNNTSSINTTDPVQLIANETESNSYVKNNLRECTPPLSDSKTKEIGAKTNDNCSTISSVQNQISTNTAIVAPVSANQSVSPAKTASDKENQPRDSRKRRSSLRSRSRTRSRSRSDDKARRSRSRDRRLSEREKSSRQFRNKSPPTTSERSRRSERRAVDKSPRAFGKNRTKSHSASRSRSPISPERRKISRSTSPTANEDNPPAKRQRCRDFDEKGYCVRGETCPWDHGINPLVLEGINNPALITMPPHLREYNPDAPELWNRSGTFVGPRTAAFPRKPGTIPGAYPRPPGVGFRTVVAPFPFPVNPAATAPLPRELIPVPVVDANTGGDVSAPQSKRRYEPEDTVAIAEGPTNKRKVPINSRLGPRVGPQQNCSLELRKIPRGMNTITHLNNHFSKFGKIVNIQISYEGDPEAAIVTFSTHAEANVAYRSTEAVLNNRFIKVFWHSSGNSGDSTTITPTASVKEEAITNGRKLSQYHLNNIIPAVPATVTEGAKISTVSTVQTTTAGTVANVVTSASSISTSTTTTVATATVNTVPSIAATHVQSAALRKNNRLPPATSAIIRKKQEEQVKAAVQLAHGLHKRKHELLQEYLKQMKQAVELVERVDHADPQRAKLLETVKNLQGIIEKLKKEIAQEQVQIAAQIQNQPPAKKSKEQQKKELLDIELELIAQQQEGNDTTAIQKRLEELQRSLGTTTHKPNFGGRTARVRTAPPGSTSVDRRPKTILITGFAIEDSDVVIGHFKHFGEITKNEIDRNTPSLKISYATRANAEQAVLRGRLFKDKRLQIAWVTPTSLHNPVAPQQQQSQQQLQQQNQQKQIQQKQNEKQQKHENNLLTSSTNASNNIEKKFSSSSVLGNLLDTTTTSSTTPTNDLTSDHLLPEDDIHLLPEDEEEEEDAESEDRSWRR